MRTKEGVEIDLIVERPGQSLLCIEIKSSQQISKHDIVAFLRISTEFKEAEMICLCNEEFPKKIRHVTVLPWRMALKKYFSRPVSA